MRDLFAYQILEHLLHAAERQQIGDQFLHHFGEVLGKTIEQFLHVLAAQQLVQMALDDLCQVGNDDRWQIHNGIASELRLLFFFLTHPGGGETKRWLRGGDAKACVWLLRPGAWRENAPASIRRGRSHCL